jgi:type II secretory pathway pseudopilin PulG
MRRAFTLIEMMVAIGVVVFLVGLTVSAGLAVANRSARIQTRATLQLLEQAMQEWEASAARQLTWWNYQNPQDNPALRDRYDIHGDTPEPLIITEMLTIIMRAPTVRQIIGQIDSSLLYTYKAGEYPPWIENEANGPAQQDASFVGGLTILDPWGVPIYATHPGRPWTGADATYGEPDPDGTIHTYNEYRYGAARNRVIRFVSAGPDRDFGWAEYPPDDPYFKTTKDNLYSY